MTNQMDKNAIDAWETIRKTLKAFIEENERHDITNFVNRDLKILHTQLEQAQKANCDACENQRWIEVDPDGQDYHPCDTCRVREFELWKQAQRYEEALEFYADHNENWLKDMNTGQSNIVNDQGMKAKQALEGQTVAKPPYGEWLPDDACFEVLKLDDEYLPFIFRNKWVCRAMNQKGFEGYGDTAFEAIRNAYINDAPKQSEGDQND